MHFSESVINNQTMDDAFYPHRGRSLTALHAPSSTLKGARIVRRCFLVSL